MDFAGRIIAVTDRGTAAATISGRITAVKVDVVHGPGADIWKIARSDAGSVGLLVNWVTTGRIDYAAVYGDDAAVASSAADTRGATASTCTNITAIDRKITGITV